ncbi:MAG: diguanylate cyclase [Anaerolineales bacterium]
MKILVISKDLMERSVIQQVLEHSNHRVTFVEDAKDAWNLIAEDGIRFVIADASTQEQSIHQLTQRVRSDSSLFGHTYILLLINKGQNGNLVSSLGVGADDYLNKPVAPQGLKARVSVGVRILTMGDTLIQARNQLDHMAMYDNLTGLMNRQAFYKVAQGEVERARRTSEGVSVIALDVDNFRTINTEHGHSVGDNVLQVVAQIIREKCRPYDCIGRWAGDQFTIALPGIVSTDAEKIAKRILAGVQASEISITDGAPIEIKLSAGIASSQSLNAYAEIDTFIQSAVLAMSSSKQNADEEVSVVFI